MSTSIIEKLLTAGAGVTGKVLRALAGIDVDGNAVALASTRNGALRTFPGSSMLDAFGRLRTSEPKVLLSTTNVHDNTPNLWEDDTTAGGAVAHVPGEVLSRLSTTTADGDIAIRQTRMYIPYQPGQSLLLQATALIGAPKTNVRKRVGYFDAQDGVFLEQTGTGISIVVRSGGVDGTPIPQASWDDPMDGNGVSKVTLDFAKSQHLFIDLEWLGAGPARIGFIVGGMLVYVHTLKNANVATGVYMLSGALPFRFEMENTGVVADATSMDQICFSAVTEGGGNLPLFGRQRSDDSGGATSIVTDAEVALMAIRLKASHNKATLIPKNVSAFADSSNRLFLNIYVLKSGSATGGAWASSTNATEVNKTLTGFTVGTGFKIYSGADADKFKALKPPTFSPATVGRSIAGGTDEVVVTVLNRDGIDSDVRATLGWEEVY